MGPRLAGDLILTVHALWVAAIVVPVPLIIAGRLRGWSWVRVRWFRLTHLAMMAVVALESLLAVACPLTQWENIFRQRAGLAGYQGSFVSTWLSRLIYFDLPPAAFIVAYLLFLAGIAALYVWAPPLPRRVPK